MAPPYLSEHKRAEDRRTFDYEDAAATKTLAQKTAVSSHTAATTSGTPRVASTFHQTGAMLVNGWQESAIDLTKTGGEISTSGTGTGGAVDTPEVGSNGASCGSSHKAPPSITAPLTGCMGIDMAGILQAGLIHPVTGQIVNGSLRGDDSLKRRRGRRRNMEALYSEFTKSRGLHIPETQVRCCMYHSVKRGNHSKGITVKKCHTDNRRSLRICVKKKC